MSQADKGGPAIVCLAGPTYKINVLGKVYVFEWHPWAGPTALNRRMLDPLANQPTDFLTAATLWAQQGRRVTDEGVCIWEPTP